MLRIYEISIPVFHIIEAFRRRCRCRNTSSHNGSFYFHGLHRKLIPEFLISGDLLNSLFRVVLSSSVSRLYFSWNALQKISRTSTILYEDVSQKTDLKRELTKNFEIRKIRYRYGFVLRIQRDQECSGLFIQQFLEKGHSVVEE